MIESYQILRWILAALCLIAACIVGRRLRPIVCFLLLDAVEHIEPMNLYSAAWWRHESLALRAAVLLSAAYVTAWGFRKLTKSMPGRLYLELFSLTIALAIALVGWRQIPVEPFHAADAARQYIYLAMAISWGLAWGYMRIEAVDLTRPQKRLSTAWLMWLWFQFIGATTGAGGLLWDVVPWKGGLNWWVAVSDISIAGQILTLLWAAL